VPENTCAPMQNQCFGSVAFYSKYLFLHLNRPKKKLRLKENPLVTTAAPMKIFFDNLTE